MAVFGGWGRAARGALMTWAVLAAAPAFAEADSACEAALVERTITGLDWDYRIISGSPGFASGTDVVGGTTLEVPAGVTLQLCDRTGKLILLSGPMRQTLVAFAATPPPSSTRGFKVKKPTLAPAPRGAATPAMPEAPSASPAPPAMAAPSVRRRTGAVRGRDASIPAYPVWPPEVPSSRASLDRFIARRGGMSLYDAGQRLIGAFEDAGYLEHSFYSAPGGFVLVTRIEKIGENGAALDGAERYRLPNQRSEPSMTDYIRGLFLEAPPGFYRYIAIVVSNEPYRTSDKTMADSEAIKRLRAGSSDLDRSYRTIPFSADYKVDALIYEFRKDAQGGKARMIDPGRLPPQTHLARTRLDAEIRKHFAR